jgi:hypothetical protein
VAPVALALDLSSGVPAQPSLTINIHPATTVGPVGGAGAAAAAWLAMDRWSTYPTPIRAATPPAAMAWSLSLKAMVTDIEWWGRHSWLATTTSLVRRTHS